MNIGSFIFDVVFSVYVTRHAYLSCLRIWLQFHNYDASMLLCSVLLEVHIRMSVMYQPVSHMTICIVRSYIHHSFILIAF